LNYTPEMVLRAGLEPASRWATDFKSVVYTIPPLQQIVLQGLEPRQGESKSPVLPLHHKTENDPPRETIVERAGGEIGRMKGILTFLLR
jgi:hypothetical protein